MAKKKRTPPPPRRVQAPKQRHEPRQGTGAGRQRLILYALSGSGIVALIVVVIVIAAGGKGSGSSGSANAIRSTMAAAGCTLATSKAAPSAMHISTLAPTQKVTFSTYPPVSGRHYYIAAIWGNYTQAVDPRQAVHNMEHGGIDVWVGPDVSSAERAQVNSFYDESPNAMLVTPIADQATAVVYPKHAPPGSNVYLTAWTVQIQNGNIVKGTNVIATCPHFDLKAFRAFRDEFRGKGPERFAVSTLTPGT